MKLASFTGTYIQYPSVSTGREDRAWELLLAIAGAFSSGRLV